MKKTMFLLALLLIPCVAFASLAIGNKAVKNTTSQSSTVISSTSIPFVAATICANASNSGKIGLGGSTAFVSVDTTSNTAPCIAAGTCITMNGNDKFINGDLNAIYVSSTVSGDGVGVIYTQNTLDV